MLEDYSEEAYRGFILDYIETNSPTLLDIFTDGTTNEDRRGITDALNYLVSAKQLERKGLHFFLVKEDSGSNTAKIYKGAK